MSYSSSSAQAASVSSNSSQLEVLFRGNLIPLHVCLVGLTWLLHDYLLTLDDEPQRFNFSKFMFLWIRYYSVALLLFDVVQIHVFARPGITSNNLCVAMDAVIRVVGAVLLWSVEIIMQLRVYALYNCSKRIAAITTVLFLGSIAGFFYILVFNYHRRSAVIASAIHLPLPGCPTVHSGIEWTQWVPATAYEGILFFLAVAKMFEETIVSLRRDRTLPLHTILLRDNLLWFFGISAVLVFNNNAFMADLGAIAVPADLGLASGGEAPSDALAGIVVPNVHSMLSTTPHAATPAPERDSPVVAVLPPSALPTSMPAPPVKEPWTNLFTLPDDPTLFAALGAERTNRTLTAFEQGVATAFRTECKTKLRAIRTAIDALSALEEEALARIAGHTELFARFACHRLPAEVIGEIGLYNVDDYGDVQPPWRMASVSRSWRAAVCGYASLWTTFRPGDRRALKLKLARSGNAAPLAIQIPQTMLASYLEDYIGFVLPLSRRWRSLRIYSQGVPSSPPALRTAKCWEYLVRIYGSLDNLIEVVAPSSQSESVRDVFSKAPKLRRVAGLTGSIPWAQLTHYICLEAHLDAQQLASSCPMLEHCAYGSDTSLHESRPITGECRMEKLKHLYSQSYIFVCSITAPALESLVIDVEQLSAATNLIRRSSCKLRTPVISGDFWETENPAEVTSLLRPLHIIEGDWAPLFAALTLPTESVHEFVCPFLTQLVFAAKTDDALREANRNRDDSGGAEDGDLLHSKLARTLARAFEDMIRSRVDPHRLECFSALEYICVGEHDRALHPGMEEFDEWTGQEGKILPHREIREMVVRSRGLPEAWTKEPGQKGCRMLPLLRSVPHQQAPGSVADTSVCNRFFVLTLSVGKGKRSPMPKEATCRLSRSRNRVPGRLEQPQAAAHPRAHSAGGVAERCEEECDEIGEQVVARASSSSASPVALSQRIGMLSSSARLSAAEEYAPLPFQNCVPYSATILRAAPRSVRETPHIHAPFRMVDETRVSLARVALAFCINDASHS
ncbi:UBA-e1-C domain-containing protein [Mycena kentingensis (nom. inval.)]|nr:UBA-e1-C domain-containing protein [Mycena kentingensis (nom. inval.)]